MPYSESVYLDCVSPDGTVGFVTRLAIHPDEGATWLWLHAFLPGRRAFGYNREDLPASAPSRGDGVYEVVAAPARARFARTTAGSEIAVEVPAHAGHTVPAVDGDHRLVLRAGFEPSGVTGSNLPGRTEQLGMVTASIQVDGETHELAARGQFHEQHQDGPRFTQPFTYGTLRGDGGGGVFLVGRLRSGGFFRAGDEVLRAESVALDSPGDNRAIRLSMEGGSELAGDLQRTWHYEVPIHGHLRTSSIVTGTLGGVAVSGCVNDWTPPEPAATD